VSYSNAVVGGRRVEERQGKDIPRLMIQPTEARMKELEGCFVGFLSHSGGGILFIMV